MLCILFLYSIVAVSPLPAVFGLSGTLLTVVTLGAVCVDALLLKRSIHKGSIYLSAASILGACVFGFYWADWRSVLLRAFFVLSVLIAAISEEQESSQFVSILTGFMLVVLVLAWVGFVYALTGGRPLFQIANADGRSNRLFLTTFSNYVVGKFIRPAGVFDEPGALSFFTSATVALRVIYAKRQNLSIVILVLGSITFSVAHAVFLVYFFVFVYGRSFRQKLGVVLVLIVALGLLYVVFRSPAESLFLSRFRASGGILTGDMRVGLLKNAAAHLSLSSVLWGLDPLGATDVFRFSDIYGLMGENPLSPLVMTGIFYSIPYYWMVGKLFLTFGRKDCRIAAGVGLLILQRPLITSLGYGLILMLIVVSCDRKATRDARVRASGQSHVCLPC